jgi:hypothetical protein
MSELLKSVLTDETVRSDAAMKALAAEIEAEGYNPWSTNQ